MKLRLRRDPEYPKSWKTPTYGIMDLLYWCKCREYPGLHSWFATYGTLQEIWDRLIEATEGKEP